MSREKAASATSIRHPEHLLDRAAMLAMRTMIATQPAPDLGPGGRAAFEALMERTSGAEGVVYDAAVVGGVPGWWCRPVETEPAAAILYLHGGAYVVGSAQAYRHFAGQLAVRAHAAVFVADYRLAPESPFPAAVEDAEAVYRGLSEGGVSRLAIAGDSAGGGLALVTAARMTEAARQGAATRPLAVVALSPWTDLALNGESVTTRAAHDPMLTRAALEAARRLYLGAQDPKDPRASPLYGAVTGLPPVMLHVGEDEILLDDATRYAECVAAAGGTAELHVWEGMVHVFPANLALLHAAREATGYVGDFLRRAFSA